MPPHALVGVGSRGRPQHGEDPRLVGVLLEGFGGLLAHIGFAVDLEGADERRAQGRMGAAAVGLAPHVGADARVRRRRPDADHLGGDGVGVGVLDPAQRAPRLDFHGLRRRRIEDHRGGLRNVLDSFLRPARPLFGPRQFFQLRLPAIGEERGELTFEGRQPPHGVGEIRLAVHRPRMTRSLAIGGLNLRRAHGAVDSATQQLVDPAFERREACGVDPRRRGARRRCRSPQMGRPQTSRGAEHPGDQPGS